MIAIVSDIHGNLEALQAVLADIERREIDEIVCLGDVIGYGPDPEFCVDLVLGHARWCLMGNHDEALFRDASDFNPHARGALAYTKKRMQPRWWSSSEKKARWKWLRALPLKKQEGRFLFVHGSPRDQVREYVLSTDGYLTPEKLRAVFESFEGVVRGQLVFPPRGDRGFGYDPIFVPEGETETFGEMDPDRKHAMSHRAVAFAKLRAFLAA